MTFRDVGFVVRGRINSSLCRLLNRGSPPACPVPIEATLPAAASPLALAGLLEGRTNEAREATVARYLEARGVPFARHRFATFEGRGENFCVEVGGGDRVLVLLAHHDAVPGSPGANDNAASVAILLALLERLAAGGPAGLRVRLLFTACEEIGYLGARAWARDHSLAGVIGALSLELCGIGDSLAVWDAGGETRFLGAVGSAVESLGYRRDESWHVVGRIPTFGSDHRAFAAAGLPAYGLSVVPSSEAEALRRFVLSPLRSALRYAVRRPPPFDTYHTRRDALATLDAGTLGRVVTALEAVIAEVG